MNKKIVFISKIPLNRFPRLLSIPFALSELGFSTSILAPGSLPVELDGLNIDFYSIKSIENKSKIYNYLYYRIQIKKGLNKIKNFNLVWLSSADSAIPLIGFISKFPFVLQINELYETEFLFRFFLKYLSKSSKSIIVPEINRAFIFKVFFKSKSNPYVLPNKSILPYELSDLNEDELAIIGNIKKIKEDGFKVVIYQGHLGFDRDFSNFCLGLKNIDEKVCLLLIGKDHGILDKYKSIFSKIIYVPHVFPPKHLYFTKMADIGLIYYEPDCLNNIYCAPNKIWEYSFFGLPFISNNLGGLYEAAVSYKAGVMADFEDLSDIVYKVNFLVENLNEYSLNSKEFYSSLDYKSTLNNIILKSL